VSTTLTGISAAAGGQSMGASGGWEVGVRLAGEAWCAGAGGNL
jgi:hypothetical protein